MKWKFDLEGSELSDYLIEFPVDESNRTCFVLRFCGIELSGKSIFSDSFKIRSLKKYSFSQIESP